MAPRKIVIIGGGVAGLCAGVYAQASGYQVDILEQHTVPGGLATSWRRGEYTFETCLHWLVGSSPNGTLGREWREVVDADKLTYVYPEEYQRLELEDGRSLRIFSHVDKIEAEFLRVAPEDEREIKKFASAIRQLSNLPLADMTERGLAQAFAFLRLLPKLPLLQHWASMTVAEYGKRFNNTLIRRFFTNGTAADASVIAVVLMFAWMSQGNAGYPIGGSKAVIDGLVARFRALGGKLRLATKVEEILVENDAAIGVKLTGGEEISADWVISAADGHATIYDMLGGKYVSESIDRFYEQQPVFSSYVQVSLGVARDCSSEPGFLTIGLNAPLEIDPATCLTDVPFRIFHYDPSFAPKGKAAITAFLPTYNYSYWLDLQRDDPERYGAEKHRIADAIIAILDRRMPGLRDQIEERDVSTPASVIRFTGNWKGSMEGFLPTPGTGFAVRRQMLPGLDRFRMVGQWVQPGGGLPAGLMTARAAVEAICKRDRIAFLQRAGRQEAA